MVLARPQQSRYPAPAGVPAQEEYSPKKAAALAMLPQADINGRLLLLDTTPEQLFADKGDHHVEIDQPEAAVGAILKMVEQLRRR